MNKIDILAYKADSENADDFKEDIILYSRNSIVLNWNYSRVWVQYKPNNIKLNITTINFPVVRNERFKYLISPFAVIAYVVQIFKLFTLICWKFRPKVFLVENFLEGAVVGIIRKCGLIDKSVYLPCDWFQGKHNKRLISRLVNNIIFPRIDYLACRLNDLTATRPETITESRNKFWGRSIPTTKTVFFQQPRIKASNICSKSKRKNICFVGEQRQDSGLDIAIRSLPKIRESFDASLKIIGAKRLYYENFVKLSQLYNVEQYVKFLGFIERKDFNEALSDCFCGINILTSINSYSSQGCPSKIIYYFQYLLPVIVTNGVAAFVSADIRDKELGLIINPTENDFITAVLTIYSAQERYRENIKKYIESLPKCGIIDFLKEEKILT